MKKWKVGDWCLQEFKVKQIKRLNSNGSVCELSDGFFSCSCGAGYDDEIFPLTLDGKVIAESFEYKENKLRNIVDNLNVNWPDIHRYFEECWCKCMEDAFSKNVSEENRSDKLSKHYENIDKFISEMQEVMFDLQNKQIHGIRFLRN